MTPHRAAMQYAASLLEQQLAAAHVEGEQSDYFTGPYGRPIYWNAHFVLDTFEKAPPAVARALEQGRLKPEVLAQAMSDLAQALSHGDLKYLTEVEDLSKTFDIEDLEP